MNKALTFDIQCGIYFCLDDDTGKYCEFCRMNPNEDPHSEVFTNQITNGNLRDSTRHASGRHRSWSLSLAIVAICSYPDDNMKGGLPHADKSLYYPHWRCQRQAAG